MKKCRIFWKAGKSRSFSEGITKRKILVMDDEEVTR
jgi:hypothetical protein